MSLTMYIHKRILIGAGNGALSPKSSIKLIMTGSKKMIPIDLSRIDYIAEHYGHFQGTHIHDYMQCVCDQLVSSNEAVVDKEDWENILFDCKAILAKSPDLDPRQIMPYDNKMHLDGWYYDTIEYFASIIEQVLANDQEDAEFIYSYTY